MNGASKRRTYFCIDMKSFYASVECADRDLNPFETDLAVADSTRGKNALCLAITPKMKSRGIRNRCRLSEIPKNVRYITAPPRMQRYIDCAADIYAIYLNYFSPCDIHVYSIDESFIDATYYLKTYNTDAKTLVRRLMDEIASKLHIPSTAGIGTNLYLAKVALDITAKHSSDRIGILDEESYRDTLWDHKPLGDFWQIGSGTVSRLALLGINTMRGITEIEPDILYRAFGVNAELLIDHAWGRESCLMEDIKNYRGKSKSVSFSQILPRDYAFDEARTVMQEMILNGCHELMKRGLIAQKIWIGVAYSHDTSSASRGSTSLDSASSIPSLISPRALALFDRISVRGAKFRRLAISFSNICDEGCEGYSLFTDWDALEREKKRERAVLEISGRYGKNAILRGTNFLDGATQRERNGMIGGHRAGYDERGTGKAVSAVRCDERSAGGSA